MRLAATLFVALVVLQRLAELAWSKRNTRRLAARGLEPAPDPVYPWMVFAHAGLLAGCLLEPWLLDRDPLPAVALPAALLFLAAQALRVWALASLGEHWNVRIFASAPAGAVAAGPYRYIRHPNYLAVLVEVATLPLVTSAWFTWLAVQLVHTPVLVRRIRDEERVLFADAGYRDAMGAKPRFLPRLSPSAGSTRT